MRAIISIALVILLAPLVIGFVLGLMMELSNG